MLRVLLISHTCQSRTEGQPKAHHLSRLPGLDLRVVAPNRWFHYGRWRQPDIPSSPAFTFNVEKVAWPWLGPAQFYLHWYPRLAGILREFQPHVIDLWEEPWGLVSAHACWLRNRLLPRTRIICETEQNISKSLPSPFSFFRAYSLKNANFAVARNQEAERVLRARGYRGSAEVVPNAVDTDLFRPLDRGTSRANFGFSGFVIGYVGRIVEEKGILDICNAVVKCPQKVNAAIVGSGPFLPIVQKKIVELGLGSRVRLIPAMPLEQLPALMNAIDCLAVPSHTTARWKEQFGRVIIEAHACETPVIGSNSGAIPDVIGQGGLVVRERDAQALASAVMRLCEDSSHCAALGAAGREQVLKRYTWEAVARQMYSIYMRTSDSLV